MIDAGQLVNGLWMGCVLILMALAPGVVQRCLDALRSQWFRLMPLRVRALPFWPQTPLAFEPPRWLAWVGVAIMLAAVLAFLS